MKLFKTILIFLAFIPNIVFGKSIIEKINKGKVITITVTPVGDVYRDPRWFHVIKIYKSDSLYFIELTQNDTTKKKKISKQQLNEIVDFIIKWEKDRFGFWDCDLQYDGVKIKCGCKTKRFRSMFFYDKKFLSEIFKE